MSVHDMMAEGVIRTERLELLPLSIAVCEAVLAGERHQAGVMLGADLGGWPRETELRGAFAGYIAGLQLDPSVAAWQGRAIVLRDERIVIGSANLKGRPTADGRVEVGYGLVDAYQGRGYAREAVAALLDYAYGHPGVRYVTAEIEPTNTRSVHLVETLGFTATGARSRQHAGHEVWVLPRAVFERTRPAVRAEA